MTARSLGKETTTRSLIKIWLAPGGEFTVGFDSEEVISSPEFRIMKTLLRIFLVSLCSSAISQAVVVINTNISLSSGGGGSPSYDYQLTIQQFASFSDPTSILFDRVGENLIFGSTNLDEGSFWYFASLNSLFNASTISQGLFPAFNTMGQTYSVGYTDFYLGVNTSPGFSSPEDYRTIYGWALLRNSVGGLQLLGSGVSYDDPGIIVGTALVPEVTSYGLIAISTLAILVRRQRASLPLVHRETQMRRSCRAIP
jgi:hypothetical protein